MYNNRLNILIKQGIHHAIMEYYIKIHGLHVLELEATSEAISM